MLTRYRRPGGFLNLLKLIETCGGAKQDKLLKTISDEDQAYDLAESLINTKYSDKWGPAGCIPIIQPDTLLKRFLFFGWASS